jgi:hypothetical protein
MKNEHSRIQRRGFRLQIERTLSGRQPFACFVGTEDHTGDSGVPEL